MKSSGNRSIGTLRRLVALSALAIGCSSGEFTSVPGDAGSGGSGGTSGNGGHQAGGSGGHGTGGAPGNGGVPGTGGRVTGGAAGVGMGGSANGGTGGSATGGASGGGGVGSSCRADTDCSRQNFLYCAAPGASLGCGNCPSPGIFPSCNTDAECNADGGTMICVGACGGVCPLKECVPGCIDNTPCAEGTHCGASHRCEALACNSGADCPANFDCVGSSCARRQCKADASCQGYCVTGYCYSGLGQCEQPRA